MARIYSNYSEEEMKLIEAHSKEMGISLSAYQKYRTLLALTSDNTFDISKLIDQMKKNLEEMQAGTSFIVSTLLQEEWTTLNRSQKTTLAKTLKKIVKSEPDRYTILNVLPSKVTQYKKVNS